MSEAKSPSPEASAASKPAATRVRRISNPRPKKTAAKKAAAVADAPAEVIEEVAKSEPTPAPVVAKAVEPVPAVATEVEESGDDQDWSEAEAPAESSGGMPTEGNKRKRRRRKGKGGGQQNGNNQQGGNVSEEVHSLSEPQPVPSAPSRPTFQPPVHQQQNQHHQQQAPRPSGNPEILAKKAWKIFLAEVSEEGVALISDHDARELSKRCFRLAEIFIEEQGRKLR